jgi:alpha-glucosidase (family GH31 glycosyl hydrolase)
MPFGVRAHQRDLTVDLGSNQGMPLLLSSKGRGIWSDDAFRFTFQAGALQVDKASRPILTATRPGGLPGIFRYLSSTYFSASGARPDSLLFTAPQYNTWIEMLYEPSQEKILAYARALLAHAMPPGVLIIDDNWHETYGTLRFHPGRFPRPRAMIASLHELGFKVMLWVSPFVSPDSITFRALERAGYLVRAHDGTVAIRQWWNGHSALLDCSNPACVTWLHDQLDLLVQNEGVDGFKFDGGDLTYYHPDDRTGRPSGPAGQCAAWAAVGLRYALNEYRASWKAAGLPLAQRLKDKRRRWGDDGLASLIPDGLAQGLLGYAYSCPDMIGGGDQVDFLDSTQIDTELFVRYAQCVALFPMMQFSTAPWRVLNDEHLAYCRQAVQIHMRLGSEIVALADHAAKTGEPIIRHLAYLFPEGGYEDVHDQFMLGETLLVAPVLNQGATGRQVVFPPGRWHGDDGSLVTGPCRTEVAAPLARLPWYRRV